MRVLGYILVRGLANPMGTGWEHIGNMGNRNPFPPPPHPPPQEKKKLHLS